MRFLLGFISLIFLPFASFACDLSKIAFGSNIEQTSNKYNLPEMLGADTEGEYILAEHGKVACDSLPESSMMEFVFIDNVLVEVRVNNVSDKKTQPLLDIAKKNMGDSDDNSRKKNSEGKVSVALWNDKASMIAVYSNHSKSKNEDKEFLGLTSKMHKKLFEKINKQKGAAIDANLKELGIGKYSSAYKKQNKNSNKNDGYVSGGAYDPNALKDLKKKYDQAEEAYKNRQKK